MDLLPFLGFCLLLGFLTTVCILWLKYMYQLIRQSHKEHLGKKIKHNWQQIPHKKQILVIVGFVLIILAGVIIFVLLPNSSNPIQAVSKIQK